MRPLPRRAATACAALTATLAALAAVAGCTGPAGGGHPDARGAAPGAAAGPAGSFGAPAPAGPAGARVRTLPDARITPATGSFTEEQKQYLHGRVPENTDPAAVLQLGQEACERVARTAKQDRDAAVGAVIAGDIPGAEDAIGPLCPDQLPILRAAKSGLPDGTTDKPPTGTYRALTDSTTCTWHVLGTSGKVLSSGTAWGTGPGSGRAGHRITARIPAGTRQFVSNGCYAWVPA